jgi:hypothetical protein
MKVRRMLAGTALAIVLATGPAMATDGTAAVPGYCPRLAAVIAYLDAHPDLLANSYIAALYQQLTTIFQNNCV